METPRVKYEPDRVRLNSSCACAALIALGLSGKLVLTVGLLSQSNFWCRKLQG